MAKFFSLGHKIIHLPTLKISSLNIDPINLDQFDAIVFTSANAIKYLKTEIINTNFGKILCFKIRPYVQYGRVFKKDESLTMWITADDNRIPIKVKADLIVGSIRIDLESFSNLTNSFKIQF